MKSKELLKQIGYNESYYINGSVSRFGGGFYTFQKYVDYDNVIAYQKNSLGVILLIKGKRKVFSFVCLINGLSFGGYDYKLSRIKPSAFFELCNSNYEVVDKKEFDNLKIKLALENI